ncbi:hypothetical protein NFI96_013244 [Prochilodus magdalenae]|nr:hypothetical protein NFI96_013244 [Prochilodus magdalenae]
MELESEVKSQQRKVIHFSSGETLEEGGSEDEMAEQPYQTFAKAGQQENLTWRGYAWRWATRVVIKSLQTCDFLGGKLAGLLGLNHAKYQYAIDEYQRYQKHTAEGEGTLLSHTETSAYGTTPKTSNE